MISSCLEPIQSLMHRKPETLNLRCSRVRRDIRIPMAATRARAGFLLAWVLALVWATQDDRATDLFVTNAAQLNSAVSQAQAGDTVTMANGSWTNIDMLFRGSGTPDQAITLRAQSPGQVILTGASRLRIAGSYLAVDGLTFKQGYLASGDVIAFRSDPFSQAVNCRLSNCAIVDFNPPTQDADFKWVSLYGFSNRVDHCFFQGKRNAGALLVVWLPSAISPDAVKPNFHLVDHNYFGQRGELGGNNGEVIRVGDATTSRDISHTIVEANHFNECNGEIEIISNKSCENVYRHNTFVNCQGALTLRLGDRCTVEGNFFFGNSGPRTGGVRVLGEGHRIFNNYFQDLGGTDGRAPLSIGLGLVDSPLDGYFQVKNASIVFNTFVNCNHGLLIGLADTLTGTPQQSTVPPVDCRIANNLVYSTHDLLVDQRVTPLNLTWEGNLMFGTSLGIDGQDGVIVADPKLVRDATGLWRPAFDSPALGAAQGDDAFVTTDVDGQDRSGPKDVGCDQASDGPRTQRPLTIADVGPAWMALSIRAAEYNGQSVILEWQPVIGRTYEVQSSADLVNWLDIGPPVAATNSIQRWTNDGTVPPPGLPPSPRFFRVKQLP